MQFIAWLDNLVLSFCHFLANAGLDTVLNPLFKGLSAFNWGGIGFLIIALVLTFIPKTRKAGITLFFAVFAAWAACELIKLGVGRMRPFQASELYYSWWQLVGGREAIDSSFPSAHAATCVAFCLAAFLEFRKPWIVDGGIVLVLLMCLARNYLMMHYPSDCVVGLVVGILAALAVHKLVSKGMAYYNRRKGSGLPAGAAD